MGAEKIVDTGRITEKEHYCCEASWLEGWNLITSGSSDFAEYVTYTWCLMRMEMGKDMFTV